MIKGLFSRDELSEYFFHFAEMLSGVIIYFGSLRIAGSTDSTLIYYLMWITLIAGYFYILHGIYRMAKTLDKYSPLNHEKYN